VKLRFVVFVGGPKEEGWIQENDRCGCLYKIGFVQRPQKLNDGSGKTIYRRMIDGGVTAHELRLLCYK
jgi:hypothetical protein